MSKAQVGDLVRILSNSWAVFNRYATEGEIAEVIHVFMDGSGIQVSTTNSSNLPLGLNEYVIHRKAGEEDSEVCDCCGDSIKTDYRGFCSEECHDDYNGLAPTQDAVNSPQHYTQGRVEVIDIIEDAVEGADPFEAVCQANIIKYTLRYRAKNGVEDLKKAQWYMSRLIAHLDGIF